MVPQCRDRPMNLWRWNKGDLRPTSSSSSRCPRARRTGSRAARSRAARAATSSTGMINDAETLRWLAQQNCITPHVWNARCDLRDKPDRIVFDLDPTEGRLRARPRRARSSPPSPPRPRPRAVREGLGLARHPHHRAAEAHAHRRTRSARRRGSSPSWIAAERPDTLTTFWRKDKREGRILVDVARNTYGQTIVAPFAVRALPGAPVAMPVTWDEVADAGAAPAAIRAPRDRGTASPAAIPGPTWTRRRGTLPQP